MSAKHFSKAGKAEAKSLSSLVRGVITFLFKRFRLKGGGNIDTGRYYQILLFSIVGNLGSSIAWVASSQGKESIVFPSSLTLPSTIPVVNPLSKCIV